jgi:hypothetical protein
MARISVGIEFPSLTEADLKELVVAHDASNDRAPITTEHVTPADVMSLWFAGEFPNVPYTIAEVWGSENEQ